MARYDPAAIFGNYSMRRAYLMDMMMHENIVIRGIWKETLFPALKDFVRYGAE